MGREKINKPVCAICDCYLLYEESLPRKQNGVTMHAGERFCLGGKRGRRFRSSDPKIHVPSWCPKRKSPCELRVYGFKNQNEEDMHTWLSLSLGRAIIPEARRYAVEYELTTSLTPKEFWEECRYNRSDAELVGVTIPQYHIVEVYDGLKSVFFYKVDGEYQIVHVFDSEKARKNKLEQGDAD